MKKIALSLVVAGFVTITTIAMTKSSSPKVDLSKVLLEMEVHNFKSNEGRHIDQMRCLVQTDGIHIEKYIVSGLVRKHVRPIGDSEVQALKKISLEALNKFTDGKVTNKLIQKNEPKKAVLVLTNKNDTDLSGAMEVYGKIAVPVYLNDLYAEDAQMLDQKTLEAQAILAYAEQACF